MRASPRPMWSTRRASSRGWRWRRARLAACRASINCAGVGIADRVVGKQGRTRSTSSPRSSQINLVGTFNVIRLAAAAMLRRSPARHDRRARRHRQHRLGRRLRRPDRPGRLLRLEGRHRRHDAADCARAWRATASASCTIAPGIFDTPLLAGLPEAARESLGQQVPFPPRLGRPTSTRRWRSTSSRTRCSTARRSASTAPSEWPLVRRRADAPGAEAGAAGAFLTLTLGQESAQRRQVSPSRGRNKFFEWQRAADEQAGGLLRIYSPDAKMDRDGVCER